MRAATAAPSRSHRYRALPLSALGFGRLDLDDTSPSPAGGASSRLTDPGRDEAPAGERGRGSSGGVVVGGLVAGAQLLRFGRGERGA